MKPIQVKILSIPNFWLTFYMYGLENHPDISMQMELDNKYREYNYQNWCVLDITINQKTKRIIIDTDDPAKRHMEYGKEIDLVFLNQKLRDEAYPNNVYSIPPHFPVKSFIIQKKMGLRLLNPKNIYKNLREIKAIYNFKPSSLLTLKKEPRKSNKYIFYHRTLWKKESLTNQLGYIFLDFFKSKNYKVVGGLFRSDGFKTEDEKINSVITTEWYNTQEYIEHILESLIVLNTPAVRGACSWRFGEYLAFGKAIVTTPFMVELPEYIKENQNYFLISNESDEFKKQLDKITSDESKIVQMENNNLELFKSKLSPYKQIEYILSIVKNAMEK